MKASRLAAMILLAACTPEKEPAPRAASAPTPSESLTLVVDSNAPSMRPKPPLQFDGFKVKPGDTIGGLTVALAEIRTMQIDLTVTGYVNFNGEAEITGEYRPHPSYPELQEPCFWVDLALWGKLPRERSDQRIVWFCFANADEAVTKLGALGTRTHATIVIDEYTTNLQRSDVWDTARLLRVVRKEPKP